jgi:hypothetical protein
MVAEKIKHGGDAKDRRQLWVTNLSGEVLFAIPFRQAWGG